MGGGGKGGGGDGAGGEGGGGEGDAAAALRTRCVELHTYTTGGGLLAAGHRDRGSVLTMAIVLSAGKLFQTFLDELLLLVAAVELVVLMPGTRNGTS